MSAQPMTASQRKAAERARKRAEGLIRLTDIWCRPEHAIVIRDVAEALRRGAQKGD